jgi:hypothetical protein
MNDGLSGRIGKTMAVKSRIKFLSRKMIYLPYNASQWRNAMKSRNWNS